MLRQPACVDEFTRLSNELLAADPVARTILVTGVQGGEGATLLAAGLAKSIAEQKVDYSVALVDTDPGSACFEKLLQNDSSSPVENSGEGSIAGCPNLSVHYWSNLREETSDASMGTLIETLASRYDVVIVDAAPIAKSPRTVQLASLVDGVLVVVELDTTKIDNLYFIRESLERANARIIGAVVNRGGRFLPWRRRP